MVTYYKLEKDTVLTNDEKEELAAAKNKPITFDEDSPEMTPEMEKAFTEARRKKPFKGKQLTLYVSDDTFEKAEKIFGADYLRALGKLLDKAVLEYAAR